MILIGSQSKDSKTALFLDKRLIFCQDKGIWTPLTGHLVVDSGLLNSIYSPFIEVVAILQTKTVINPHRGKFIFNQMVKLNSGVRQDNTTKFDFEVDFGSLALPPSFNLPIDPSNNLHFGVSWFVYGLVGTQVYPGALVRDNLKVVSATKCPIAVTFGYTSETLALKPALCNEVIGVVHFQTLRTLLSRPPPTLTAKLLKPIFDTKNSITVSLDFGNIAENQQIDNIKVELKQMVVVQYKSTVKFKYKRKIVLFDQRPAPSYDSHLVYETGTSSRLLQNVVIDVERINELKKDLILTYPADTLPGDAVDFGFLVPSTQFVELEPSQKGVLCTYSIKIIAEFSSSFDFTSKKFDNLKATLPIVVSCPESITNSGAEVIEDEFMYLTNDAFMPILDKLLEDLSQSLAGLKTLSTEWKYYRREEQHRVVTDSSDHADQLLGIVDSFSEQLALFIDHLLNNTPTTRVKWKRNNAPFNLFLLELELLVRACPSAPLYQEADGPLRTPVVELFDAAKLFLDYAHKIVMAWIKPLAQDDPIILVEELNKQYLQVRDALIYIADGGDFEPGEEKVDTDLVEAIRISCAQ